MPSGRKALDFSRAPSKSPHKPQTWLISLAPLNMFSAPPQAQRSAQVSCRLWYNLQKLAKELVCRVLTSKAPFCSLATPVRWHFCRKNMIWNSLCCHDKWFSSARLQLWWELLCTQVNKISASYLREKGMSDEVLGRCLSSDPLGSRLWHGR